MDATQETRVFCLHEGLNFRKELPPDPGGMEGYDGIMVSHGFYPCAPILADFRIFPTGDSPPAGMGARLIHRKATAEKSRFSLEDFSNYYIVMTES